MALPPAALPHLGPNDEPDRQHQEGNDARHDELVLHEAARHVGQDLARLGDVVVRAVQRVVAVLDGFALAVQVPQNADTHLLHAEEGGGGWGVGWAVGEQGEGRKFESRHMQRAVVETGVPSGVDNQCADGL